MRKVFSTSVIALLLGLLARNSPAANVDLNLPPPVQDNSSSEVIFRFGADTSRSVRPTAKQEGASGQIAKPGPGPGLTWKYFGEELLERRNAGGDAAYFA